MLGERKRQRQPVVADKKPSARWPQKNFK